MDGRKFLFSMTYKNRITFQNILQILCKNIADLFDSLYELKISENGCNDLSVIVRVLE